MSQHDLGKCVVTALEQYFRDLDGEKPAAIYDMAKKLGVDAPLTNAVHSILYEGQSPQAALRDLMARTLREE